MRKLHESPLAQLAESWFNPSTEGLHFTVCEDPLILI
jgi:hypothetical protein